MRTSSRGGRAAGTVIVCGAMCGVAMASTGTATASGEPPSGPGRHVQQPVGKLSVQVAGDAGANRFLITPLRESAAERRVTVRRNHTVTGLPPGRYRVVAPVVEHAGVPISPEPQRRTVAVRRGRTAQVAFSYPRALVALSTSGDSFASRKDGRGCVVDDTGTAWCWRPGDRPVAVRDAPALRQVVAGGAGADSLSCGLTRDGRIWCWKQGQSPVALPSPAPIRRLVASFGGWYGNDVLCGFDAEGRLWCWDWPSSQPFSPAGATPKEILPGGRFTDAAVSAGTFPALCVTAGATRCYRLEHGWTPGPIGGPWYASLIGQVPGIRFTRIAGSPTNGWPGSSFCGVTAGQVWCWTVGFPGEPVGKARRIRGAPRLIAAVVGDDESGSVSGCGLTRRGAAWCWALNGSFPAFARQVRGDFRALAISPAEGQLVLCGLSGSSDVRCGDGRRMKRLPAPWREGEGS